MLRITTGDGTAEAFVAEPPKGAGPGVLFFPDSFGVRPRTMEMATQIAGWGYNVLLPNLFHRDGSIRELRPRGDLTVPAVREELWRTIQPRMARLTTDRALSDVDAYVATLRALPATAPGPIGVVGFCMGARLAVRTAGRYPDAVAACAGFHGGGLVTDAPDSPHLALRTARAEFVFGHADNDRSLTTEDAAALGAAALAAGLTVRNEIYPGAMHGYTMSDTAAWDAAAFGRAFDNLRDLLDRTLTTDEAD